MSSLVTLFLAVCAVPAASAAAQASATTPAPARSRLLGTWSADIARLPIPAERRPRSVTMTFSDEGAGKWRTNVDIVAPDGGKVAGVGSYTLDGTPAPSTGYPGVDTVAITMPAPNVMVAAFYKDHMPRTTRTYVVAPDG